MEGCETHVAWAPSVPLQSFVRVPPERASMGPFGRLGAMYGGLGPAPGGASSTVLGRAGMALEPSGAVRGPKR
eukprot:1962607-Pyramimonas_sp.AAC.1